MMKSRIENHVKNYKLFDSQKNLIKINIPEYQRNLSWTKNDVNLFLESFLDGKFLGTIIFKKKSREEYDLIDGQQRLSVLSMFLEKTSIEIPYFISPLYAANKGVITLSSENGYGKLAKYIDEFISNKTPISLTKK